MAALVFTALSLQATRDQVRLAEQGQVTDRFAKGVEQLGATSLSVRLGAIYAPERVARDSPPDQPAIIQVLTTFVRERAPRTPTEGDHRGCPKHTGITVQGTEPRLAADLQAALTVLGRRDTGRDSGAIVDLRGACLSRADLTGAHLPGAVLTGSVLEGVEGSHADLRGASLDDVVATGARLDSADLTGATLSGTFDDAHFTETNLTGAHLEGSFAAHGTLFSATNLTDATVDTVFPDAHVDHVHLAGAHTSRNAPVTALTIARR
ncbi:pentapeptide repeat-containing protein [Amycolatopsis minnesotensis]|uniref:pentapeptide repeat-containing protein n=1 Tax=Amycolatopsis minnesotensis TaxID=337894 RepID=UPI0031DFC1BE